jgi:hypothetical protein
LLSTSRVSPRPRCCLRLSLTCSGDIYHSCTSSHLPLAHMRHSRGCSFHYACRNDLFALLCNCPMCKCTAAFGANWGPPSEPLLGSLGLALVPAGGPLCESASLRTDGKGRTSLRSIRRSDPMFRCPGLRSSTVAL